MLANHLKSFRAFWLLHNSSSLFKLIESRVFSVITINRMLFQQNQTMINTLRFSTSSKSVLIKNIAKNSFDNQLSELDYQLNEVKVFQDEQIIQFSFKSGQSINFTMSWLRNLCSCPECLGNKLRKMSTIAKETNGNESFTNKTSNKDKSYNVSRIKCDPGAYEFEIEWLEDDYRSHSTIYDLRHLIVKKP